MGKVDETMVVLRKASEMNKHPLPANMDKILNQVSPQIYPIVNIYTRGYVMQRRFCRGLKKCKKPYVNIMYICMCDVNNPVLRITPKITWGYK